MTVELQTFDTVRDASAAVGRDPSETFASTLTTMSPRESTPAARPFEYCASIW